MLTSKKTTVIGTMSVVIGAVVNIILDPILIYVFHMGVRGAAIATVDRKSTRLNSSHITRSRMPSSA